LETAVTGMGSRDKSDLHRRIFLTKESVMKKLFASALMALFLVSVSGPVMAVTPAPTKAPVAKTKKHKKKTKKSTKAMKSAVTPVTK